MSNGQDAALKRESTVKRLMGDIEKRRRSGRAMTAIDFFGDPYKKVALSRLLSADRKRSMTRK